MGEDELLAKAKTWLQEPFDLETRKEVQRLIEKDRAALSDAFFKDLSFGTGGMRGLMGVGTHRLNIYTIRGATQGLANYLKTQAPSLEGHSVFIGYDVRHHSQEFANEAARVLAGNGIKVWLTKEICPTPLVSYGCRIHKCSSAIMITASHNPPAYNGYKVYWSDGGQVVPPHDEGIIEEVRKVDLLHGILLAPLESPLIQWVGRELDDAYLTALQKQRLYPDLKKEAIDIVYTPLHGTGMRILPQALKSWGFSSVELVEAQSSPDPHFSKAPSPNPEEEKALAMGTEQLIHRKRDLLIATDPDADRMGIAIVDRGRAVRLSGNQIACLILFHICTALSIRGEFPPNAAFIKTLVTTELFRTIAESFGGLCIDVLTGFKYIGEKMTLWEHSFDAPQYVFGAEESYGYLFGMNVRDKDAISSACLIAEAAALAKEQNMNLLDRLYQIYRKYGVYREKLSTLSFSEGAKGLLSMKALMECLRKSPPTKIGGKRVVRIEDYGTGIAKGKGEGLLSLPKSDVLLFWLEDESKLVIRPSGTEPKVKIYVEAVEKEVEEIELAVERCDQKVAHLTEAFRTSFPS
jgi:phosphomannomutase